MKITLMQLVEKLIALKGTTFVSLVATSSCSNILKKGLIGDTQVLNPHYKQLTKTYIVNCMIGFKYEPRINKVRSQCDYEPRKVEAPVNGHIKFTPALVAQKNGNVGMACEIRGYGDSVYTNTVTGQVVNRADLDPFIPERKTEIAYITPNLCNILEITIGGATYTLDHSDYESVKEYCSQMVEQLAQFSGI